MQRPDDTHAPIGVTDNPAANRYEAMVDGVLAVAEYQRRGNVIVFTHTSVPPAIEGRGVADMLARTALDAARAAGNAVVPQCAFFAAFMRRHPEYGDLASPLGTAGRP